MLQELGFHKTAALPPISKILANKSEAGIKRTLDYATKGYHKNLYTDKSEKAHGALIRYMMALHHKRMGR